MQEDASSQAKLVAEISSKIDYILGEGRWEAGDF
jgi:hypothetical protein